MQVVFFKAKKTTFVPIKKTYTMSNKISPSAKQKGTFIAHLFVFIIANIAMWAYWYFVQGANHEWKYPWAIWLTAAWALSLLGHWAALYTNYEDAGNEEYLRQLKN